MTMHSYSKPLAWSHAFVSSMRAGRQLVYQEKVDGSQISFQRIGDVIEIRSRNADARGNSMFALAVEVIDSMADRLVDGWTYRGEYLAKPKHNTLRYGRVPAKHIALFDVDTGHCDYVGPQSLRAIAEALGLEAVPTWEHEGAPLDEWMERESFLGGCKVEGWVAKDYGQIGPDGKVLMAKMVSESFKESHKVEWRASNPTNKGRVQAIMDAYRTEARWAKAVQHLRESGDLVNAPQDIGRLMKEVSVDVESECAGEIKELLWAAFRKDIIRNATRGLPEWYKASLGGDE